MSLSEIPAVDYHADKIGEQPTLSKSIMHTLLTQSPKHAWTAHPRLNPNYEHVEEDKFNLGKAAHALYLEGDAGVQVCDYPDWRTKDAKEARELARSHGKIPMLGAQWDECQAMVLALEEQLGAVAVQPPLFEDGLPEQTLTWEENGVACRARLDWLRNDNAAIDDYKTTSASANPEAWTRRTMFAIGADLQAAFYARGLMAQASYATSSLDPQPQPVPAFRFVVQETFPPYALSVIALGPDVLALANAKVDSALATWRRCLSTDSWPAYPTQVCYAGLPGWMESQWLEREAREDVAA